MHAQTSTTKNRRQFNKQAGLETLSKAVTGQSHVNYPRIFAGFAEMGIPMEDIKPRENVFTYNAWKTLGRQVRRGEHGVKIFSMRAEENVNQETGEVETRKRAAGSTVFHISQTDPIDGVTK